MKKRINNGYTLAEVLVAACLIGIAIGGGASLMGTMNIQEDISLNKAVGINFAENAARSYQLGLSTTTLESIMPGTTDNPELARAVTAPTTLRSFSYSALTTLTLANSMGTLNKRDISVAIRNPRGGTDLTHTIPAYTAQLR